ncbi:hypothetical protein SERLA73DRAFT_179303 [Serpula lacrymans var. lacrymans S7.3]|uniref:F-box domain-containing protein n=2 Tax=Serpula lacrymans var. lacrymans TaxID=341189 RepID=F8PRV8_SERL3|nr:uncharacterized protein SERLADRAFT_464360 [Serpula lacrymans var. lacrymans S7.9]EGO01193.1 hypothetical protein SERLA73DRAFT_179303 [Serpula lacrymans var. lacrymans S7.3]EGO26840.1 hypothetical protein SERLADRAFT_464360 [Serpula lacrymans var. lacrymans S7.9]
MVSADNLNLDVLELIFAYLAGNDLVSIALVSRSFLAGVIPRLYSTVSFKLRHSARYNSIFSPFAVLKLHPDLAIHVRRIDIHAAPVLKAQTHPIFLAECAAAMQSCKNLTSFTCLPKILAPLLESLQGKQRLENIHIHAALATEQSEALTKLNTARSIVLDFASWSILNLLPKWAESAQRTLTTLALYMTQDLNECILEPTIMHLPNLLGLHIIGCSKVNHHIVLKLATRTHLLEELSFTIFDSSSLGDSSSILPLHRPPLQRLRHLALDIRAIDSTASAAMLSSLLTIFRPYSPRLRSFTVKVSDRQLILWDTFLQTMLDSFAPTLTHLAFMECTVANSSIRKICDACTQLERLEVAIPVKDLTAFGSALTFSSTLETLVDIGDSHATHGPRPTLNRENVRNLMLDVRTLRKVVSDSRIWTGRQGTSALSLTLQRSKPSSADHWFFPRV